MSDARRDYVPAAGRDWALPFYDPFVALMGGDRSRRTLIGQAALRPGNRVLDIGCGTGTLAVLIKRLHPHVHVAGLDPDPKALARARRKAERAAMAIEFDRGFSDRMAYPDASFDRVFSSFMLHHLSPALQEATLREVHRVLEPGGTFHLVDFVMGERGGFLARLIHTHQHVRENSEERLLGLMGRAGFADARRVQRGTMLFGHAQLDYFRASR